MQLHTRIVVGIAALVLSACGGGGSGDAAPAIPPAPAVLQGVLTDADVAGISYTSTSGPGDTTPLTGTTDANGGFRYSDGDTVTFSAGNIVVGELPAAETITPRELGADIVADIEAAGGTAPALEDVTSNLYVFFQSLDTDDDPNTITVPTNLGAADLSGLSGVDVTDPAELFNAVPAQFASDLQEVVTAIVASIPELEGEIEVVDLDEALQHAAEQNKLLLAGTWRLHSTRQSGAPVDLAITFFANGAYLKGGLENDPNCNDEPGSDPDGNGAELGTYHWNPLSGEFTTGAPTASTDGSCGLGDISAGGAALQISGDELRFYAFGDTEQQCVSDAGTWTTYIDGAEACRFALTRAANAPEGIEGSWVTLDGLVAGRPAVLTIAQTGTNAYAYHLVDASYGSNTGASNDGVEIGSFTVGNNNDQMVSAITLDTNGEGGMSHLGANPTVALDNGDLLFNDSNGSARLVRLPLLPRFSASQLAGLSFFAEVGGDGIAPNDPDLLVFTFFADGTYVLAGHNNDPNCDNDYVNAGIGGEADPDGNGMEWGTWDLDPTTGALDIGLVKPLSETNGSCGLYSATNPGQQFFIQEIGADQAGPFIRIGESRNVPSDLLFRVVPSEANSLIGSWTTFSPTDDPAFEPEIVTFFSDGTLISGSTRQAVDEAGIERFQWSLNEAGDQMTLTMSLNAYPYCMDTIGPNNNCTANSGAGVSATVPFSLGTDGRTATLDTTALRKVTSP